MSELKNINTAPAIRSVEPLEERVVPATATIALIGQQDTTSTTLEFTVTFNSFFRGVEAADFNFQVTNADGTFTFTPPSTLQGTSTPLSDGTNTYYQSYKATLTTGGVGYGAVSMSVAPTAQVIAPGGSTESLTGNSASFQADYTKPAPTIALSDALGNLPSASLTNGGYTGTSPNDTGTVYFKVDFADNNFDLTSVDVDPTGGFNGFTLQDSLNFSDTAISSITRLGTSGAVYIVKVTGIPAGINNESLGLNVAADAGKDKAGNGNDAAPANPGNSFTVDTLKPTPTISLNTLDASAVAGGVYYSNQTYDAGTPNTLSFTVAFLEDVDASLLSSLGVYDLTKFTAVFTDGDFTALKLPEVLSVTRNGLTNNYTVAVSVGEVATGKPRATIGLRLEADKAQDEATNGNAETDSDFAFTVDQKAPVLTVALYDSTDDAVDNPDDVTGTSAGGDPLSNHKLTQTLRFSVDFGEAVTGAGGTSTLSDDDFEVVAPGITATYTITVAPVDAATGKYTVTVSGVPAGVDNETLTIQLKGTAAATPATVKDLAQNGATNGATPAAYTVDTLAPVLTVALYDSTDDAVDNPDDVTGTSAGGDPLSNHKLTQTLRFSVDFGEAVTGAGGTSTLSDDDFEVVAPGITATYTITVAPVDAATGKYTVTVSGVPAGVDNETLTIQLKGTAAATPATVKDLAQNGATNGATPAAYTVDTKLPTVTSISFTDTGVAGADDVTGQYVTGSGPAVTTYLTNKDTLHFTVVFDEAVKVSTVTADQFMLNFTSGDFSTVPSFAASDAIVAVSPSADGYATTFTVTVSSGTIRTAGANPPASSTISLSVKSNSNVVGSEFISTIEDRAQNTLTVGQDAAEGNTYTLDQQQPTVTIERSTMSYGTDHRTNAADIEFKVTFSEPVKSGDAGTNGSLSATDFAVVFNTNEIEFRDTNGNIVTDISSILTVTPVVNSTTEYLVVVKGVTLKTSGSDLFDTATLGLALAPVSGTDPNTRVRDLATNQPVALSAAGTEDENETYTVDRQLKAPTIARDYGSIDPAQQNQYFSTSAVNPLVFTVDFGELVTGVNGTPAIGTDPASDFVLDTSADMGTAEFTVVGIGPVTTIDGKDYYASYKVTVTPTGVDADIQNQTFKLKLIDNDSITDVAGNLIGQKNGLDDSDAGLADSTTYIYDSVAPAVSSISLYDDATAAGYEDVTGTHTTPGANPTTTYYTNQANSGTGVRFTVVFAEPVLVSSVTTGQFMLEIADGDFDVDPTFATSNAIVAVSPSNDGYATTFTITVQVGTLNPGIASSALSLSVKSNSAVPGSEFTSSIVDQAFNLLNAGTPTAQGANPNTYTVDQTAPTITSILRTADDVTTTDTANPGLTNKDTVRFVVTFSEAMRGLGTTTGLLGTADFALVDADGNPLGTSDGVENTGVEVFTDTNGDPDTTGTKYVVTVLTKGVIGAGSAGYNGTLNLEVASGYSAVDRAGNDLNATLPTNPQNGPEVYQGYTIDHIAPTLDTIAGNTDTTITFEDATQMDGTRQAEFTVTFSEPVTGVVATAFTVVKAGTANFASISVTPSGSGSLTAGYTTWTVILNDVSGEGTLELTHTAAGTIQDTATNALVTINSSTSDIYTVDLVRPTILTISGGNTSATPTKAATVDYVVTFSEAVNATTVMAADFDLIVIGYGATDLPSIASISPTTGSNTVFTITVNTGIPTGASGTITLKLKDDGTAITAKFADVLGNTSDDFTVQPSGIGTFTIDKKGPTASDTLKPYVNTTSVTFNVTFTEVVYGDSSFGAVTTANFIVSGGTLDSVSGNGPTYTISVSGISSGFSITATGISDYAGNAATYSHGTTLDQTPPAVTFTPQLNFTSGPTYLTTKENTVTFFVSASDSPAGLRAGTLSDNDVSISSTTGQFSTPPTFTIASASGGYTITVTTNTPTVNKGVFTITVNAGAFTDNAGNSSAARSYDVTVDKTPPTLSMISSSDSDNYVKVGENAVTYTLTFNEPVKGLVPGDLLLTPSAGVMATLGTITRVGGSAADGSDTWTVEVTAISGTGSLTLTLASAPATTTDTAGNILSSIGAATITTSVDTVAPTLKSIQRVTSATDNTDPGVLTNASSYVFKVTFTEAVTGVGADDFLAEYTHVTGSTTTPAFTYSIDAASTSTADDVYYVTVTTTSADFDGSIVLRLKNSPESSDLGIADSAANPLTTRANPAGGTGSENQAYTIDRVLPSVKVITTTDTSVNFATTPRTVTFTVEFSESVGGVGGDDFALDVVADSQGRMSATGTISATAVGIAATEDSGSGRYTQWTITVTGISGEGDLGLKLAASPDIRDRIDNNINSTVTFTTARVAVDTVLPTVAVTLTDADNSGGPDDVTATDAAGNKLATADTLHFTVTFSEEVDGLTFDDLTFGGTYAFNPSATNVTITTPATGTDHNKVFTVAVSGIPGSTTGQTLNFTIAADKAQDLLLNGNTASAAATQANTYLIDRVAPTVTSITRYSVNGDKDTTGTGTDASLSNMTEVRFTVVFSEKVKNVDAADFEAVLSGVTQVIPNGMTDALTVTPVGTTDPDGYTTYTVTLKYLTVDSALESGTVGLRIAGSNTATLTASINDTATNALLLAGATPAAANTQSYTLDQKAPTVVSVTRPGTSSADYAIDTVTSGTDNEITFTVTFSENVKDVDADDFILTHSPLASGQADTATGTISVVANTAANGSNVWTVKVSGLTGQGIIGVRLRTASDTSPTGPASINDVAANPLTNLVTPGTSGTAATNEAYNVDLVRPIITMIERSNSTGATVANTNDPTQSTYYFKVTFSEKVAGVTADDFTIQPTFVAANPNSLPVISSVTSLGTTDSYGYTTWLVKIDNAFGNGSLQIKLKETSGSVDADARDITDFLANKLTDQIAANATNESFAINQVPYVVSINRATNFAATEGPTLLAPTNNTVNYTVTFSEPVTGVDFFDFAVFGTDSVAGARIISVTPNNPQTIGQGTDAKSYATTYTVTVDVGTGSGQVGLDLRDNDTITDQAVGTGSSAVTNTLGAQGAASGTGFSNGDFTSGQRFTIDKTAPTIAAISKDPTVAEPTKAPTLTYTVVFSESVTGVDASDFTLVKTGGQSTATFVVVPETGDSTGTRYTVTVTTVANATGTIRLDIPTSATVKDDYGNALTLSSTYQGPTYTVDRVAPTVSSIARVPADVTGGTQLSNKATVSFTVTFSENVFNVDTGDFSVVNSTGAVATGYSVSGVTVSGQVVTVDVTTPAGADGSAAIFLKVLAAGTTDGIADAATNKFAADFTGTQGYTIDRTAPTLTSITYSGTSADERRHRGPHRRVLRKRDGPRPDRLPGHRPGRRVRHER